MERENIRMEAKDVRCVDRHSVGRLTGNDEGCRNDEADAREDRYRDSFVDGVSEVENSH